MPNKRQELSSLHLTNAIKAVRLKLDYRIKQKGPGTMASCHEILGILTEEMREFEEAVHLNKTDIQKVEELLDIAVGAVFGIASITSGGVDW